MMYVYDAVAVDDDDVVMMSRTNTLTAISDALQFFLWKVPAPAGGDDSSRIVGPQIRSGDHHPPPPAT